MLAAIEERREAEAPSVAGTVASIMLVDDAGKYGSRKTVGSGLTGLTAFAASMGESLALSN